MSLTISPRRVVVVLGMHRSGTSLFSGVLQTFGVQLGEHLIEGDTHNSAGYFEHADIVRLHEQLLDQLDRRWTLSKGTLSYPTGWWQAPEIRPYQAQLTEIVARELAHVQGLWGFKDPRTSRLIPLWKEIFRELGVTPLYFLAIRHPQAVTASVVKRDGLSPARAQLLWLMHNLDALRDTREEPCQVVDYDRWFTHPREQAQATLATLGLPWPEVEDHLLAQLARHVRPELRHHDVTHLEYLPYIAEAYELLIDAAVTGTLPNKLWELEADVRRAQALLSAWRETVESIPAERRLHAPLPVRPDQGFSALLRRWSTAARVRLTHHAHPNAQPDHPNADG